MEKVTNKMSVMQENWYEDLYYDPEELRKLGLEEAKAEARKEARAEGLAEGKAEGLAEGRAEGREQNKVEIAKNMLKFKEELSTISKYTGLSLEQLKELQKSNKEIV